VVDFVFVLVLVVCYFHVFQVVKDIRDSFGANRVKKKRIFQKNRKIQFLVDFCQFLPILCIKKSRFLRSFLKESF
jgi:hypothetical protein